MATFTSAIQFTGRLGNIVGYHYKGKHRLRTVPELVRQTIHTRRAARDFGTACHTAAILRHGIMKDIGQRPDNELVTRLNKAMLGVVRADIGRSAGRRQVTTGNLHQLVGFQTNRYCSIKCDYSVQRYYKGGIEVTVTHAMRQLHDKVKHVQFRAIAVFPDFERGKSTVIASEPVMISRKQPVDAFCLHIPVADSGACVVLLEAIAHTQDKGIFQPMGFRNYNAADIVAVLPPAKKSDVAKTYPLLATTPLHTPVHAPRTASRNPG